MTHGRFGGRIQQIQVHGQPGQCLQGQRRDEFAPAAGQYHPHLGALILEAAHQLGALVSGDATSDAQHDAFTMEPLHIAFPFSNRLERASHGQSRPARTRE